jgi:putative transposase
MSNIEKNKQIKKTLAETKERRKSQKCFVFSTKIDYSKLNKLQREQLQMLFIEGKWVYNDILNFLNNGGKLSKYNTKKKTVSVKQKHDEFVEKPLKFLKSSYRDSLVSKVSDSLNSLKELKKKGHKVGRLKFKSSCSQLNLKQFNNTHRIKSLKKVSIQGIKGDFRVHGLEQFADNPNYEITNAKLLKKPDGYYINWTTYIFKNKLPVIEKNEQVIGIDFGCGTSFVFSDGRKIDFKLKEPECIKKLQKSLARKRKTETNKKHSNQYKSDKRKLEKKYQKLANKKNDTSNKLCHSLSSYRQVIIQDENLVGWKKSGHGKAVQHSILGRVKKKLKTMTNVTILSRFAPTTKLCFHCGEIHNEIKVWDRVFECNCGVYMDRDVHAAQCMVWMYLNDFQIPTEHRNKMHVENKSSGKYSIKKKTKSCSLKPEANRL